MIMETAKKDKHIFLVLVPHRDIRTELQKYYDSMFKNNLAGVLAAYSFPCVVPLAGLSKPFNTDELKNFARSLREAAQGDKFNVTEASTCAFPAGGEETALFGQGLELNNSNLLSVSNSKIITLLSPTIIGACLMPKNCKQQVHAGLCGSRSYPQISFRAAAVANMFWKPINLDGGIRYKWKIGKLCWLPKKV